MKQLLAIFIAIGLALNCARPTLHAAAWDLRFQQYDSGGVLRTGNMTVTANSVLGFNATKTPVALATTGSGNVVKDTAPTISAANLTGNTTAANISASGNISGANLSGNNTGDQNTYTNIIVGNVTVSANATAGNLTLIAGSNIGLSADSAYRTITISSSGGGGGGDPAQNDLAGGTVLNVGSEYYDTISSNRTLTFNGTASEGSHIALTANVTVASTLTVEASYRWGETTTTTTIPLRVGFNYLRWDRTNSKWMLTDTARSVSSLGNQTVALGSVVPIGNNTADGKATVGDILALSPARITVGNNTVSANATSNITIVSANGNLSVSANTSNNTIVLNSTSSGTAYGNVSVTGNNIDWSLGTSFYKTLAANTTITSNNTVDGKTITLALTNTAGNYTANLTDVIWPNGSAPTFTVGAKTDLIRLEKINGTIFGSVIGQNYTVSSGVTLIEDDFNRSNSTNIGSVLTEASGDSEIASNKLRYVSTSALVVTTNSLGSPNQAVKYTAYAFGSDYITFQLRYSAAGQPAYELYRAPNNDWVLQRIDGVGGGVAVQTLTGAAYSDGTTWGVTITGTGASTVVRLWLNPVAAPNAIVSAAEWDVGSTAHLTFTNDPASPVDTGNYVGAGIGQASGSTVSIDNFQAAPIP